MTPRLTLSDHASLNDLRVYLERLQRSGQAEVRLITRGSVLAVFGCTQSPTGLMDTIPVVLVLRSYALAEAPHQDVDITVFGRALLDRIARTGVLGLSLDLPDTLVSAAWAGVLPPQAGWQAAGTIDAGSLATVAEQGIERVAEALPESPGEALVRKVRESVWGAPVAPGVPAAAAFAAEVMGFLRGESTVQVSRTLTWVRLSSSRGQVLVRSFLGKIT